MGALLDWLNEPRANRGVHLARDGDEWEFWSYREIARSARRAAHGLREAGAAPGDVISVVLPTGIPFISVFFGSWILGATPCPVVPPGFFAGTDTYVAHLAKILEASGAAVAATDGGLAPVVWQAVKASDLDVRLWNQHESTGEAPAGPAPEIGLLQFTSGSTGAPRGVQVSMDNLEANVREIHHWMDWDPDEASATWLPLHHDMGLIGTLLTAVATQSDLWLMRPEQFLRDPLRWLKCLGEGRAHRTTAPTFGYAYALRFMTPHRLEGLRFDGWRAAIVGAERVDAEVLTAFAQRLGPQGFSAKAFLPAYGLAEATLAVTGDDPRTPPVAVLPDWRTVTFGAEVKILEHATICDRPLPRQGEGWLVGCGPPMRGSTVEIVDQAGRTLPDGRLGEVAVSGPSVTRGYRGPAGTTMTRFQDGRLLTGDAGFRHDGSIFLVGRIADSLKVRGRSVYMEDLEVKVAGQLGLRPDRCVLVSSNADSGAGLVLLVETRPGDWVAQVPHVLRQDVGDEVEITVVTGRRGLIRRGSSGKPRRRFMWEELQTGRLPGTVVLRDPAARSRTNA